jgi:hypothetical protein
MTSDSKYNDLDFDTRPHPMEKYKLILFFNAFMDFLAFLYK